MSQVSAAGGEGILGSGGDRAPVPPGGESYRSAAGPCCGLRMWVKSGQARSYAYLKVRNMKSLNIKISVGNSFFNYRDQTKCFYRLDLNNELLPLCDL